MLLSIPQAAEELGVTPASLRRQVRMGLMPGYRVGPRIIRIDLEEVKESARRGAKVGPNKGNEEPGAIESTSREPDHLEAPVSD